MTMFLTNRNRILMKLKIKLNIFRERFILFQITHKKIKLKKTIVRKL